MRLIMFGEIGRADSKHRVLSDDLPAGLPDEKPTELIVRVEISGQLGLVG